MRTSWLIPCSLLAILGLAVAFGQQPEATSEGESSASPATGLNLTAPREEGAPRATTPTAPVDQPGPAIVPTAPAGPASGAGSNSGSGQMPSTMVGGMGPGVVYGAAPIYASSVGSMLPPEYYALERQAAEIARAYREAGDQLGEDHPEQKARRDELKKLVEKAFALRQGVQQKELQQLKQRLDKVARNVERRADNRGKIIEKRIDELLHDNDLDWNAGALPIPGVPPQANPFVVNPPVQYIAPTYTQPVAPQPSPSEALDGSGRRLPSNFPPTLQNRLLTTPTTPTPAASPGSPAAPPTSGIALAGPTMLPGASLPAGYEQRNALRELRAKIERLRKSVALMKDVVPEGQPNPLLAKAESDLKTAQRQFEDMKQEMETNLKLLQLDVQTAETLLSAARVEFEQSKQLVERGTIPSSSLPPLEAKVQHANAGLQRAHILLELNRKTFEEAYAKDTEHKK